MVEGYSHDLMIRYLRQQRELGLESLVISSGKIPGFGNQNAPITESLKVSTDSVVTTSSSVPDGFKAKTYEEKRHALKELFFSLQDCTKCNISKVRRKMVFGGGNAGASVMVIGEAPGEDEDNQGLPFVGLAGRLLTKMLGAIDLDRGKDTFITNILKCRPPGNRNPEDSEILACMPIVEKQIEIIAPKALLLLGRIAAHELLKTKESIARLRSQLHTYKEIPAVVTYHPAALLRNQQYKKPAWEDLQKLRKILTDMGVYENRTE